MAYTATYEEGDMAPIVIDGLGAFGAGLVVFAGLLALAIILGILANMLKKIVR